MKVKFLIVLPIILCAGILIGHVMQVLASAPTPVGHTASQTGGDSDAERTFYSSGKYTFLGPLNVGGSITRNGNTVWDAGNDGSGLDADLLDSQHGSYYLDTSATAQTKAGSLAVNGNLNVGGNIIVTGSVKGINTLIGDCEYVWDTSWDESTLHVMTSFSPYCPVGKHPVQCLTACDTSNLESYCEDAVTEIASFFWSSVGKSACMVVAVDTSGSSEHRRKSGALCCPGVPQPLLT